MTQRSAGEVKCDKRYIAPVAKADRLIRTTAAKADRNGRGFAAPYTPHPAGNIGREKSRPYGVS
jgi:hypothetical protein